MSTFVIPNVSKLSAISCYVDGEIVYANYLPIVGWVIDDSERHEFCPRSAAPVLLEEIASNETLGILLETGGIVVQEEAAFPNSEEFKKYVADKAARKNTHD